MRPLIGTSTKMNLTPTELNTYLRAFRPLVSDVEGCDLFVLPAFPALWVAREILDGSNVAWGAQDVHEADAGAHTGDVSAAMLADLGCTFVEVGHAERRRDHGETDELVATKVAQITRHRMLPIVCVGEKDEIPTTDALTVVLGQLRAAVSRVSPSDRAGIVVAYEPVWAIGVGARPASAAHVRAIHERLHAWLTSPDGGGVDLRVIYGGSVDPRSAGALLALSGVDGLFVGRAALDPAQLASIAHAGADAVRKGHDQVEESAGRG